MQKDDKNNSGNKKIVISEEPEVIVVYDRQDPEDISNRAAKLRQFQQDAQRTVRDYLLYRQDTRELLKKRRIAADTNSQLATARSQSVQDAYDFHLGTEKELVLSGLKEHLESELLNSEIRRSIKKLAAINEAAAAFNEEISRVKADLPNYCKDIVLDSSIEVLGDLINKIVHADSDVREVISKNCPRKKRSLLRSIFCTIF